MKTIQMKMMMKNRETVIPIPVVTNMTGTMMIIIAREEVEEWVEVQVWTIRMMMMIIIAREAVDADGQEWITRMMTMMIIIVDQEIAEADKEEINGAMGMMMIIIVQEVLIQEKDLAVWVEVWDLGMVGTPAMVMKAVINIQEDKIVEVTEAAEVLDMTAVQIMGMVMVIVANLQGVSLVAAVSMEVVLVGVQVAVHGEAGAIKVVVVTGDILKINI
jgi:hypothetical protein